MARSTKGTPDRPAPHPDPGVAVHGWVVLAHPLFLDQFERLIVAVETERAKGKTDTANQKVLAGILRYAFDEIPRNPASSRFRQGNTLGREYRHWRRAKFGHNRFRLFFRYDARARVIVLGWVNDAETLRARGSKSDAYAVFRRMLDGGTPPDEWEELLRAVSEATASERLRRFAKAEMRRGQ